MTVEELICELQEMNPDAEVRLAQQPRWPFEYSIGDIVEVDLEDEDEEGESHQVVYLGEGSQLDYLPGQVSQELGW